MKIFSRKSGREFRKSPDWMPMCTVFNSQLTQCAQCSTVSWFIMYIVKLKGQCVQSSTGSWFIVYRVRMKGQCVYRVQQSADLMCTELEWKVTCTVQSSTAYLMCTELGWKVSVKLQSSTVSWFNLYTVRRLKVSVYS